MSNARSTSTIVILGIAAILLVIGALAPGTTEISEVETYDFNPDQHPAGTAKVISTGGREGFTLFWITFRQPEYYVDVMFAVPEECEAAVVGSSRWPVTDAGCTGPDGLSGTIAGTGRTAAGDTIVNVRVDVDEACHTAVEPGMDWPLPAPACEAST